MKNSLLKIFVVGIVIGGIVLVINYRAQLTVEVIQQWVQSAGNIAPLLFILIYILATVLFFPGAILTLLGGALFGPVMGVIYNLTGSTIGAICSFLIARYVGAQWIEDKAGGKIKQLITGVENEGWRFVAFTRLVPLFPFNLLNYGLGLTKIKLSHYSIASYIFMLPAAIAYTYLGYIGKEAVTGGDHLIKKILLAMTLLALVAFLPRIIKSIRKGVKE